MMTIHTHARRGRALGLAVGSAAAALALSGLAPSGAEGANIALGRAVVPSGPTWPGFAGYNITDNNLNTIVHPAGPVTSFSYLMDLGQEADVNGIEIFNRNDCCPERLMNYRVELLPRAAGGGPGTSVYSTDLRTDGTNSGLGGVDTVPNVNSRGRYVRISRIDDGTADYHPQIAEVHVEGVAPQRNVARGRPVIASGPTWTNFPASNITDGSAATITHPLSGEGGPFSCDVDLGQDYSLDRIQLYNRGDDCCPERLSNYTVSLHADDNGAPGSVTWEAQVRADGSNSGNAGLDELFASDGTGTFTGRWIHIQAEGTPYGPQIAEVEAYAVPEPSTGLLVLGFAAGAALFRRRNA